MKYDPKDGEPDLLPEAWYDATLSAEERVSKAGNDMMVVTARIYHQALPIDIDTYFVTGKKASINRLKKLCGVLGIDFDAGVVTSTMFNGKGCKVQVKTEHSDDPKWDDKNVVAYFASSDSTPPNDDEIPF